MMAATRPEVDLLALLTLVGLSDEESGQIESLVRSDLDWQLLLRFAEHGATVPLIWSRLKALDLQETAPEQFRQRAEEISRRVARANADRLEAGKKVLADLAERGVDVIVLKGIYFAESIYRNPHYKKMNDIDILVRKDDLDTVFDVYQQHGMFCAGELVGGSPRKQEKFSHHAPPFFTKDLKLMVGTHWGLITPLSSYQLDYPRMWERKQPFDFYGIPLFALSPHDNLHHLCVHLPYYKSGVRELADIYNLLRSQPVDWDGFLAEVEAARTQEPVYHALALANALHPMPEMERAMAALHDQVGRYCRRDTAAKVRDPNLFPLLRSTHMARIEKAYSKIAMTDDGGEKLSYWLTMWKNILAPPRDEVARMNAREELAGLRGVVDRAITPWRIYKVFERDVGAKIFAAIVTKVTLEVAEANVARLWRPAGKNLQQKTRELGVSGERVAELLEALE